MKSILLFFGFVFFVNLGCRKDKECNPSCGPLQQCDDGVCLCPNGQFLLGNSCKEKCPDCFEGSFTCGCTDKYIFDISKFDDNTRQISLHYVIPGTTSISNGMTDVTKLGENVFKFNIPRRCDEGGKKSTNIEFTVDKSDSARLKVQARYHILPSNETLGTCETVFTK